MTSEKSACNSPRNRLPIDFKFRGYITRIHKVQFDPFNEMFLMIFISVDWIMQIGTGEGHEKLGTLGRFFGAPNDGHEQKRAQPHALDPCECVWVDFNIAKAITVKLWGQKSWKVAFFRMTQELKIWPCMTFTLIYLIRIRAVAFKVKSIFFVKDQFSFTSFFAWNFSSEKFWRDWHFPILLTKSQLRFTAPTSSIITNHTNSLSLNHKHSKALASNLRPWGCLHENCFENCPADI